MRAGIVGVLCFAIGVGVGFGAGTFFFKKKHKKEENVVYIYKSSEKEPVTIPEETPVNEQKPDRVEEDIFPQKTYDELTSYARPYRTTTEPVKKVVERLAEKEAPVEEMPDKKSGPKLIKAEDYGQDPSLGTITLYLYSDGVLANDEEEALEVDVYRRMIGDCLEKFDFRNSSETTIYVRNRKFGSDFEIVKVHGPYDP